MSRSPAPMPEAAVVDRLRPLMARLVRRGGVHHVALGASAVDGSWTWVDAIGSADRGRAPMRADTPWCIASVTKLHIAAVVLRLHEQGRLDLNAPLPDLVPEDLRSGLHVLDDVDHTNRLSPLHLLGHLSGLPDYLDERPRGGRSLLDEIVEGPDRRWTPEDAVRWARDRLTPHFPPSDPDGARPRIRYSDTNYQLLVVIAQHVAGRTMDALYRELVFEPIGLRDTGVPGLDASPSAREPATVWLGRRPFDDRPAAMASFGDLFATTDDLLRFGRARFGGGLFTDSETIGLAGERFHRFGLPRGVAGLRAPSWPIEYGLGLMRFAPGRLLAGGIRLPVLVGHTGSTGSWLWHAPELGLVVAGTVDQTSAAAVPFRSVPRALATLRG